MATAGRVPLTIYLLPHEHDAVRALAREDDRAMSYYVSRLVQRHVAERGGAVQDSFRATTRAGARDGGGSRVSSLTPRVEPQIVPAGRLG